MRAVVVVLLTLAACGADKPAPRDVSDFCAPLESACGRHFVDEHGRVIAVTCADAGRE